MRRPHALVCATLALLAACQHAKQDKEAVRTAIVDYAKTKASLDLSRMDVQVSSVNFHDRSATAVVAFKDTSSPNSEAMEWSYNLESEGDKWVVKGKGTPINVGSHAPGMGAPPAGVAPNGALPPGHPPVTSDTPAAPQPK